MRYGKTDNNDWQRIQSRLIYPFPQMRQVNSRVFQVSLVDVATVSGDLSEIQKLKSGIHEIAGYTNVVSIVPEGDATRVVLGVTHENKKTHTVYHVIYNTLDGLNPPTEDTPATNKGYVDDAAPFPRQPLWRGWWTSGGSGCTMSILTQLLPFRRLAHASAALHAQTAALPSPVWRTSLPWTFPAR